ncbi:zinc finger protein 182-like [Phlebotomus papatasi]|uniref:zinc finger protein 182-like n=1 Tax=Phlebotomus papatasi TaxID=29031 RepID=UPI002484446F|nr:zinc finger protein 182-like [Phlebotomus papatasi]
MDLCLCQTNCPKVKYNKKKQSQSVLSFIVNFAKMRDNLNLFTLQERIFLVKTFYKNDCNVKNVKSHYLLEYGELFDDVPTDSIIFEVINLFEETGNIKEIPEYIEKDKKRCIEDLIQSTVPVPDKIPDVEINTPSEALQSLPKKRNCILKRSNEIPTSNQKDSPKTHERTTKKQQDEATSVSHEKTTEIGIKAETGISLSEKKKDKDIAIDMYICDICKKTCHSKRGMQLHMVRHIKKEQIFCQYCQEKISSKYQLRIHIKAKHGNVKIKKQKPEISCNICMKVFTLPHHLRQHMLRHSDKKDMICEICGKAFKRRQTLLHHKKVHTGEKPFKCDFPNCERAFRDRNSITIHKRCHLDERPFPCHYCGKCFRDKGTLRIHYRQHTGENPYKCELCGKETKQKQNLKSHMMHFHRIK